MSTRIRSTRPAFLTDGRGALLLVWSCLLLLPLGRLVEIPVLAMAAGAASCCRIPGRDC